MGHVNMDPKRTAHFHLPGLFEFYDFYRIFLPLFREHREYFYDRCEISSIYGAPEGCIWGGGRVNGGDKDPKDVLALIKEFGISPCLTFSNSLLAEEHLQDKKCNDLCRLFRECSGKQSGIIVHSELLLQYLKEHYPEFYLVSSTTKVLTRFPEFEKELDREDFRFAVPDFRLNKDFEGLKSLNDRQKSKVEFLCNECCPLSCSDRKACYEAVSRKNLGIPCEEHVCKGANAGSGYVFSKAMENPAFISIGAIWDTYLPMGFSEFKIEGRGLGSALVLEFLLYYMTKPECRLKVREAVYLDSCLDLF